MNRAVRALAVSVALVGGVVTAGGGARAAVSAAAYVPGTIRPSVAQSTQDTVLTKYYAFWKANFLTTKCGTGTYAVLSKDADHSFVAEGEGYGMTIAALMATKDPDARKIFDGILKFVKAHPSVNDKDLHAAEQDANCKSVNAGVAGQAVGPDLHRVARQHRLLRHRHPGAGPDHPDRQLRRPVITC